MNSGKIQNRITLGLSSTDPLDTKIKEEITELKEENTTETSPYLVVQFRDGAQLIPRYWMIGKRRCRWPNHCISQLKINRLISDNVQPTSDWGVVDILNVYGTAGDYKTGMMKVKLAQQFSDIDDEFESSEVKNKKCLRADEVLEGSDGKDCRVKSSTSWQSTPVSSTSKNISLCNWESSLNVSSNKLDGSPAPQVNKPQNSTSLGEFNEEANCSELLMSLPSSVTTVSSEESVMIVNSNHNSLSQCSEPQNSALVTVDESGDHTHSLAFSSSLPATPRSESNSFSREESVLNVTSDSLCLTSKEVVMPDVCLINKENILPDNSVKEAAGKREREDFQSECLKKLDLIFHSVKKIKLKLDELEMKISKDEELPEIEPDILQHNVFPLQTFVDVNRFETRIKVDTGFFNYCVRLLKRLGGKDIHSVILNVMRSVMTNELGENYSLLGRNKKIAFKSLKLYEVVFATVRHHNQEATESDINTTIARWLVTAKSRKQRRESVSLSSSTTVNE